MTNSDQYQKATRTIGSCIYCNSTKPPLTKEHVLPKGLAGFKPPTGHHEALILQKASCEECRQITRRIEGDCMRGMDNLRNILGWKKKAQDTVLTYVKRGSQRPVQEHLNAKDVGATIVLPVFDRAGGVPYHEISLEHGGRIFERRPHTKLDSLMLITPFQRNKKFAGSNEDVLHQAQLSILQFSKMLAKIALGFAVLKYGKDGFDPIIADFIRGKDDGKIDLIGGFGAASYSDPPLPSKMHRIDVHRRFSGTSHCATVYIRLFACYGAPMYYVIAGTFKD
jgi:hypothetical protein